MVGEGHALLINALKRVSADFIGNTIGFKGKTLLIFSCTQLTLLNFVLCTLNNQLIFGSYSF